MRTRFLLGVAALTAVAVVQWLPSTVQAAEEVPTACITTPAPQGLPGDRGPEGDKGEQGDPGTDATPPPTLVDQGPSRQVHPAIEELPLCADIEGLCIVKLPGEKGPIGQKGDTGDTGDPGTWNTLDGPGRAPHSFTGIDPCAGVDKSCEITVYGTDGIRGLQGDKAPRA